MNEVWIIVGMREQWMNDKIVLVVGSSLWYKNFKTI